MQINLSAVGQRIKSIRKNHHYSMAAFAKLIGTSSASTVNNWEKGNNLPKLDRLEKIAILGNTTTNWLLYGDFKTYLNELLATTPLKQPLTDLQLQALETELLAKKITYQDDLTILQVAAEKFPTAFAPQYPVTASKPTLIAEDPVPYAVESQPYYSEVLLPQLDALLAGEPEDNQQTEHLLAEALQLIATLNSTTEQTMALKACHLFKQLVAETNAKKRAQLKTSLAALLHLE